MAKGCIGARQAAECNDALKADYAAEKALAKARETYQGRDESGTAFWFIVATEGRGPRGEEETKGGKNGT